MHGLTGGSWKRHTDRTRATEMKDTRGNLAVTSGSETYRRCALPRQLSTLLPRRNRHNDQSSQPPHKVNNLTMPPRRSPAPDPERSARFSRRQARRDSAGVPPAFRTADQIGSDPERTRGIDREIHEIQARYVPRSTGPHGGQPIARGRFVLENYQPHASQTREPRPRADPFWDHPRGHRWL